MDLSKVSDWAVMTISLLVISMEARSETYLISPDGTGDFPTIRAAIDAAVDGDVIQLTDGVFPMPSVETPLRFHGKEITLESFGGDPEYCILQGTQVETGMLIVDGEGPELIVRGITIKNFGDGSQSGAALLILHGSYPTFERCWFIANYADYGGAFAVGAASATFVDCEFRDNRSDYGGAVGHTGSGSDVILQSCVMTGNDGGTVIRGGTFVCGGGQVVILDSTISGNSSGVWSTPDQFNEPGNLSIIRSVLWGNCGSDAAAWNGAEVSFDCSLVDSTKVVNQSGTGIITYLPGNVFTDPLFCGPEPCASAPTLLGDYSLNSTSPALLAPCGPIGALGEGCTTVSIQDWSWGRIKGVYRLDPGTPSGRP